MSDSLREALTALSMWCTGERLKIRGGRGGFDNQTEREIGIAIVECEIERRYAALSAPQADAEAVAWVVKWFSPNGDSGARAYLDQKDAKHACENIRRYRAHETTTVITPLYTAPPSQSAQMRKALFNLVEAIKSSFDCENLSMAFRRRLQDADAALSRADGGKESEGGAKAGAPVVSPEVEDTVSSLSQSVGALHPSDPTPPDRVPGLNWELSEETKKRLAEIDQAIVSPGDPRLNQIICGPQPNRPAQKAWPNGCRNPNSCEIHRDCMYVGCANYDRDISGEVDAALLRGGA